MVQNIDLVKFQKIKIISKRKDAINYALNNYILKRKETSNILLLAGKGHETKINIKGKLIEFNETSLIQSICNLNNTHKCIKS